MPTPEPDIDAERAERIRALKDKRGWTFQRLADELGVSKGTAESWVYRHVKPNYPHLAKMAVVFDVTTGWLETGLDGDDPPADPVQALQYDMDKVRGQLASLEEKIRFIASNTDRITALEGFSEETRLLIEQQAAALMPLVTSLAQAAADRRQSSSAPPERERRRKSGGRRRNDPPAQ